MSPTPDFASLSMNEIARFARERKLPPVHQWNPDHCGDSEMRIAADGTWLHQGSPIGRPEMVRLFSTILRREPDGSYVLVTPAEKLSITVDDAPFVAHGVTSEGSGAKRNLAFHLNTGEAVLADKDHAIIMRGTMETPRPYLHVRGGLEALIARPVFYELAHFAMHEADTPGNAIGVWSHGQFFPLEPGR